MFPVAIWDKEPEEGVYRGSPRGCSFWQTFPRPWRRLWARVRLTGPYLPAGWWGSCFGSFQLTSFPLRHVTD